MTDARADREVDDFSGSADDYRRAVTASVSFSGQDVDYFAERKAEHLVRFVDQALGAAAASTVLDVGCGVGTTDAHLTGRFASVDGVDVSVASIEQAAAANPSVRYQAYAGDRLPFADASFDVAFAACVFHHVVPAQRPAFTREMRRVVRPDGVVVVFEHNPLNPLTRYAVNRCELDTGCSLLRPSEVRGLFESAGLRTVERSYISLFPTRRPALLRLEHALRAVPLGGQYFVGARR
jgi:SAM-dependent methyltransferase